MCLLTHNERTIGRKTVLELGDPEYGLAQQWILSCEYLRSKPWFGHWKAAKMGPNRSKIRTTIQVEGDHRRVGPAPRRPGQAASCNTTGGLVDRRGRGGRFQSRSRGGAVVGVVKIPTSSVETPSLRMIWKLAQTRRHLAKLGKALKAKRKRLLQLQDPRPPGPLNPSGWLGWWKRVFPRRSITIGEWLARLVAKLHE